MYPWPGESGTWLVVPVSLTRDKTTPCLSQLGFLLVPMLGSCPGYKGKKGFHSIQWRCCNFKNFYFFNTVKCYNIRTVKSGSWNNFLKIYKEIGIIACHKWEKTKHLKLCLEVKRVWLAFHFPLLGPSQTVSGRETLESWIRNTTFILKSHSHFQRTLQNFCDQDPLCPSLQHCFHCHCGS